MSQFFDKLVEALQSEDDKPLYDSFVKICYNQLPPDTDERYQWLRNNGYVARDEEDISVYVAKVAGRHAPKFRWLYDNLFMAYTSVFQGEIDLVVWGCGCGLDLLALYDRALKQNNPQLWLTVRSVTLIDISDSSLQVASEIANLLFPMATGKIKPVKCDLLNGTRLDIQIPRSHLYTPRVHLLSNIIDLFQNETVVQHFAAEVRRCAARRYRGIGKDFFNDIWIAFSPEYGGYARVEQHMLSFRAAFGEGSEDFASDNNGTTPDCCAYCAFVTETLVDKPWYLKYKAGNRVLKKLVKGVNDAIDSRYFDDGDSMRLIKALFSLQVSIAQVAPLPFLDCYEWCDVQHYKNQRSIERLLLVPKCNSRVAPCVIRIGRTRQGHTPFASLFYSSHHQQQSHVIGDVFEEKKRALRTLSKVDASLDEECIGKYSGDIMLLTWDGEILRDEADNPVNGPLDMSPCKDYDNENISQFFMIDPKGAKPLPDLDTEMDKEQREIIFGRRQLWRIRGGAGCGKTTTMLWHAVMSILRTHQPVLIACRTETLFTHNQRRMAATLLSRISGLEYVERDLIQFSTIDKYICKLLKGCKKCKIRQCGNCKENLSRRDKKMGKPEIQCPHFVSKAEFCLSWPYAEVWPVEIQGKLTSEEKGAICRFCKQECITELLKGTSSLQKESERFGAVMVDEIQSIDPKYVQALFNLTATGNPFREFYAFCDERQSLKSDALEHDSETQKLRVKTPRTSGSIRFNNNWRTLKRPYRLMDDFSGVLSEVAESIRGLGDDKYGVAETELNPYQPLRGRGVFSVTTITKDAIDCAVWEAIKYLKALDARRITVICDNVSTVRDLLNCHGDLGHYGWNSTHTRVGNFIEEQRLRRNFEEREDLVNLTTVELAQGWDLENVILVITDNLPRGGSILEATYTGITRSTQRLRIIDASPDHWVYEKLKGFNVDDQNDRSKLDIPDGKTVVQNAVQLASRQGSGQTNAVKK